jgi:hypothetical protein
MHRFRLARVLSVFLTLFTFALASRAAPARAETAAFGSLQEIVADAAKKLIEMVGDSKISVGDFGFVGKRNINGGPQIAEFLRLSLNALKPGVVILEDAPFEIKGQYLFIDSPDPGEPPGQKVVKIDFQVIEIKTGSTVQVPITRLLRNNTAIVGLLGIQGTLPNDNDPNQSNDRRKRNQAIQDNLGRPQVLVDPARPTRVGTKADSPFRVEILAGPLEDGKTRPTVGRRVDVSETNGLPFVKLDRDEVYELRITNASPEEAAVRVTIDGIDIFHFSKNRDAKDSTKPRFTHLLVPRAERGGEGVLIAPGWHNTIEAKDSFLAFLVTAYGKGASSQLGIPASGGVGVIQVQFSKSHFLKDEKSKGNPANETGFGPPRDIQQKAELREIEPATEIVSIRYTR